MFPGGVLFDNEVDDYRTDNENEVFKIFRRISANYKEDKTKATSNFHCLSPYVGSPYKLSNKFIEDLQKIHDYITCFHIGITRSVKSKIS